MIGYAASAAERPVLSALSPENDKRIGGKMSLKSILAVGVLAVAAVGCVSGKAPAVSLKGAPVTLKIGVIDPLCKASACSCVSDAAIRAFEGMTAKVAAETGIVLEMEYFEDPQLLDRALQKGLLDGMIGKYTTCGRFAHEAKREFERLADITKPTGEAGLRGVFITFKDSPVKRLEDIPGHVLGLGVKEDTEKCAVPLAMLKKHGIAVSAEKQAEFFDCKSAALALMENRADVAVISDYALEYGCIVVVGDPKDFHVIATTEGSLPFTTFMVDKKKVPAELRARLAAELLTMTGANVPQDLFTKGWVKPVRWPADTPKPW